MKERHIIIVFSDQIICKYDRFILVAILDNNANRRFSEETRAITLYR